MVPESALVDAVPLSHLFHANGQTLTFDANAHPAWFGYLALICSLFFLKKKIDLSGPHLLFFLKKNWFVWPSFALLILVFAEPYIKHVSFSALFPKKNYVMSKAGNLFHLLLVERTFWLYRLAVLTWWNERINTSEQQTWHAWATDELPRQASVGHRPAPAVDACPSVRSMTVQPCFASQNRGCAAAVLLGSWPRARTSACRPSLMLASWSCSTLQ